jgi:hypothetical protein
MMNPAERAYWKWCGYTPEEYGRLCREETYDRALKYLNGAREKDRSVQSSLAVTRETGVTT